MNLGDWTPFDLTALSENEQEFYKQFLGYAKSSLAMFRSTFKRSVAEVTTETISYLADRRFNARARSSCREHWIGVNAAVPCLLHFCFNNILRLPTILPFLGDADGEERYSEFPKGIPLSLDAPATLTEALTLLPGVSRPRDDARALAASALTELACSFCIFHEVAHVVGGHTGYSEQHLKTKDVSEFFGIARKPRLERNLRRVWEFEADKAAAVMLMSFILNDNKTRKHYMECFDLGSDGEASTNHLLVLTLFALDVLFLYLAQPNSRINSLAFHPHPVIRSVCARDIIQKVATRSLNVDAKSFEEQLDKEDELVTLAWDQLGLPRTELRTRESIWPSVGDQLLELEADHQRLLPQYQTWAWIPESIWVTVYG